MYHTVSIQHPRPESRKDTVVDGKDDEGCGDDDGHEPQEDLPGNRDTQNEEHHPHMTHPRAILADGVLAHDVPYTEDDNDRR